MLRGCKFCIFVSVTLMSSSLKDNPFARVFFPHTNPDFTRVLFKFTQNLCGIFTNFLHTPAGFQEIYQQLFCILREIFIQNWHVISQDFFFRPLIPQYVAEFYLLWYHKTIN